MSQDSIGQSRLSGGVVRLVYLQKRAVLGPVARLVLWILGVDVPKQVRVGSGLKLGHPTAGIVVHPSTTIGDNVTIFHGTTIGRAEAWRPSSEMSNSEGVSVGSDVVIGAGAVVLFRGGARTILGDGAIIGANAVLTHSVGPGEIWAGNPARLVGTIRSGKK